jgi:hypothetical protein
MSFPFIFIPSNGNRFGCTASGEGAARGGQEMAVAIKKYFCPTPIFALVF